MPGKPIDFSLRFGNTMGGPVKTLRSSSFLTKTLKQRNELRQKIRELRVRATYGLRVRNEKCYKGIAFNS